MADSVKFEKIIDNIEFSQCEFIAVNYFDMDVSYIFEDCDSDEERKEEKDHFVEGMKLCLKGENTIQDFIEGTYFEESDMGDNIQNIFKVYEYLYGLQTSEEIKDVNRTN